MKLIHHPNPLLSMPCDDVRFPLDESVRKFVLELRQFMKTLSWGRPMGLAAVQVGNPIALFIDGYGNAYCNPKIIECIGEPYTAKEGCYSLEKNKYDYRVKRYPSVVLLFNRLSGSVGRKRFSGIEAQAIQHEVDHCEGRLCVGTREEA